MYSLRQITAAPHMIKTKSKFHAAMTLRKPAAVTIDSQSNP
jgi:hypothetical protein